MPTGSAAPATWAEKRGEDNPAPFHVVEMARDNMARDALQMAMDYDHVVIDGPRDAEKITRAVVVTSEFALVPIEPSAFSTDAAQTTIAQIQECQIIKPDLKAGIVVSRKITGTVIGEDIRAIAAESEIPILNTDIRNLVAHAEAATMAQTIFEYQPNSDAAKEIRSLALEIGERYNGPQELRSSAEKVAANT